MKRALLILALLLMSVSATSPLWVGWAARTVKPQTSGRFLVQGRITGDLPENPWAGTVVSLGSDRKIIPADGTFSFAALPGTHILRICCSIRFQAVYDEVHVEDKDVYLEYTAKPLVEIAGRVESIEGRQFKEALKVSAWLIGTNRVEQTVVYSDGTFLFHLSEGEWQLDLDNLPADFHLISMVLDGRELRNGTFTIPGATTRSLALQIKLK